MLNVWYDLVVYLMLSHSIWIIFNDQETSIKYNNMQLHIYEFPFS